LIPHLVKKRIFNGMFASLFFLCRFVAGSIAAVIMVHGAGAMALTPAMELSQTELPTLSPASVTLKAIPAGLNQGLLAHHGGESAGAGTIGTLGGAQLLGSASQSVSRPTYSDSLWGNLLLSMAYQRDPELQKLIKRMGHVNTVTLLSVAGVSGLALAQSIYSYRQIEPKVYDVTPAHHAGGHDHIHMAEESRIPSTLGIIGSGATMLTLGVRAVANLRYGKKIQHRQQAIIRRIDNILGRLEEGASPALIELDLSQLVGARACSEFLALWRSVHSQASGN
jgi:hypothetical protein